MNNLSPEQTSIEVSGEVFFSSRRRHTRCSRDWSSDVCSSDLRRSAELQGSLTMSARDTVEIGLNRFARRGYDLDEVSIVPSRRTRDVDDVSTAWQIDAFRFEIPLITSPSDAVVSPATAVAVGNAGGLGVLNAEGLWTRYEDPEPVYRKL